MVASRGGIPRCGVLVHANSNLAANRCVRFVCGRFARASGTCLAFLFVAFFAAAIAAAAWAATGFAIFYTMGPPLSLSCYQQVLLMVSFQH